MSRYEQEYEKDMGLIATRQALYVKLLAYWKPELQRVIANTSMTTEEKVQYLLGTVVAKKILTSFDKEPKSLEGALTKYVETQDEKVLLNRITALAESATEKQQLSKARSNLTSIVPEKILGYLPTNLVVNTDPQGQILDVYTRFANKEKNLGIKIEKQKAFMKVKSRFEAILNNQMRSNDPKTRMKALIIAIMYETGVRPGEVGKGHSTVTQRYEMVNGVKVKLEEPIVEEFDTFGAISLLPEHIKIINGVANLVFHGKAGTVNKAYINNMELNKQLIEVVKKFVGPINSPLFSVDGTIFTQATLTEYYKKLLEAAGFPESETKGHTLTDMRKLKSSTTLHQALLDEKEDLNEKLLEIEDIYSDKALKQIQKVIVESLERAFTKSETALNHTTMSMTINSYINPKILLNYFQNSGDIDESFADIIENDGILKFNLRDFVNQASYSRFVNNEGWKPAVESGYLGMSREEKLEDDELAKQYSPLSGYRMAKLNKKVIVVDRIEGNKVVCSYGRSTFIMPLMALPVGVKEGMSLEINLKPINTKFVKNKLNQVAVMDSGDTFHI